MASVGFESRDGIVNQSLVQEHIYLPLRIVRLRVTGMIKERISSFRPLLPGDLNDLKVILQAYLIAKGHFSSSECACLLSHRQCLVPQPLGQGCPGSLESQPMFSHL